MNKKKICDKLMYAPFHLMIFLYFAEEFPYLFFENAESFFSTASEKKDILTCRKSSMVITPNNSGAVYTTNMLVRS